eukprot:TRINITY_DN6007_c0_g1_i1.p1 TRINITY_DN6007_c0_g1~~TRINITY_DN6007_c0_g1_i1.p1  ORF type:complete len:160 (+),score=42.79 TRINITY_DN6007_c0_g1_i1:2-481(+)
MIRFTLPSHCSNLLTCRLVPRTTTYSLASIHASHFSISSVLRQDENKGYQYHQEMSAAYNAVIEKAGENKDEKELNVELYKAEANIRKKYIEDTFQLSNAPAEENSAAGYIFTDSFTPSAQSSSPSPSSSSSSSSEDKARDPRMPRTIKKSEYFVVERY